MSLNRGSQPPSADVSVPASVANLGGGFDTLAVAVQLYLRLRIVDVRDDGNATLTVVKSTPAVRAGNAVERAYNAVAQWTGVKAPSVFVEAESDIPMASGLGSSAAAAVAGLRTFERVTRPLPDGVLLAVAASIEGHADNAAAAIHGGLTSVVEREDEEPVALQWHWPEALRFVVATPSGGLSTTKARAALPDVLPREDAVFNLQRVLAIFQGKLRFTARATGERGVEHRSRVARDHFHGIIRPPREYGGGDVLEHPE